MRPLPRSFSIQSLQDFAAGLPEELLLCVVRSLREYVKRTSWFVNIPRRLFVSPHCPSRAMSKNGISFLFAADSDVCLCGCVWSVCCMCLDSVTIRFD